MVHNFDVHAWNRNRLIEGTLDDADLKAKERVDTLYNQIMKDFPDKFESSIEKSQLRFSISTAFVDLSFNNSSTTPLEENNNHLSSNSSVHPTVDNHDNTINEEDLTEIQETLKVLLEEKGYSPFLVTKDNPKGETKGLDDKTLNKILMKMATKIQEAKPGLWANLRAKKARGEKPSHGNSKAFKSAVKAGEKINNKK